jgi:predicted dehydrogenase
VKILVVGTGGVAERHLGALREIGDIEVVAHVSGSAERAERQAARWGGRAYPSIERAIDAERPEAAWLCLVPDRHGPPEDALIAAGVPFFVEKPLGVDRATPRRVAHDLARRGLIAAAGYKLRALDTLDAVRVLLRERPARMVVGAWHDVTPAPEWWRDEARSGGQFVEQATHLVDLARHLVGEGEVVGAIARSRPRERFDGWRAADVTAALIRFSGGVPGSFTATCVLDARDAIHLRVVCEGVVLTISERRLVVDDGREQREVATSVDPFVVEDAAFVRAVRERDERHILSAYADAVRSHELCVDVREAAGSGSYSGLSH